ncbi:MULTISPECIES: rod shape-determining protein RodA [unclassified Pedobacter]|uniref:rod shape-determining protein RodA n=1 Tax=Pedobacter TaxID=84567 RepID=UPI000B4BA4CE|nr:MULTISPECIES: rod shape-determining protein RodA [unclassified Pedobacter]MCX2431228.1 rod shape-determining protein RodA [Pedobacter sp. GR22-10]MCX2584658.1 rod shape-determining protein RodA [Pedobacter sp. MR22-3]OWK71640.1 rod shape-determining protein RodA [Pedobacter sp. AJM]
MQQQQGNRFFFNVDWITVLIYIALCAVGFINIFASVPPEKSSIFSFNTLYGKQLIYVLTGLVLGLSILLFDGRIFNVFSPFIYGGTLLLLLAVLVIGNKVAGNQAWIAIGSFKLQPAEFAKFGTALLLARYVGSFNPKFRDLKSIAIAALIVGAPLVLIMLQPDTGSALVFLAFMFPLYREGLSGYFLLIFLGMIVLFIADFLVPTYILIIIITAVAGLFIYNNRRKQKIIFSTVLVTVLAIGYLFLIKVAYEKVLAPHQRSRIELMLGLKTDNRGAGYNVIQSQIAIGSGQVTGRGFLEGTQTKYGYVPEQSTDFIFSTIGEEWGFLGCSVVIALYIFLLLRLINLAERQRSTFSRVYGYSVACILFFHVFINIGMTIGIIPVIGIPLPLISYGGSSLWSFTILLFIFLKLDSNRMGFF